MKILPMLKSASMKTLFFSIVLFASSLVCTAQPEMVVDPNAELRTLDGHFNRIQVSHGIDLYLSQSENEAIAVSASEDRFRSSIRTEIKNGVLMISYQGDRLMNMGNKKLRAYVSFKNLRFIEASGSCDVLAQGVIAVPALTLELSGSSDFKAAIKVDELRINLSGSSDVNISGSASTVKIQSSGASDVKAYGLIAETCTAETSGASDIQITVNKELSAEASGSSYIYYKGNPAVKEKQVSGSSKIRQVTGKEEESDLQLP
jgi:hypothetical protein